MLIDKRKTAAEKTDARKYFETLPESLQIALRYYNWILFDCVTSKNYETFDETLNFRLWCLQKIEALSLPINSIPMPTRGDLMAIWFDIRARIDIDSVKSMKNTDFTLEKKWNGYVAVSLEETKNMIFERRLRQENYKNNKKSYTTKV